MTSQAALPDPIVTPLGFFTTFGEALQDRISLCSEQAEEIANHLDEAMKASGAKALSLDVFDTLLLRNDRSEAGRFWDMAVAMAQECPAVSAEDVVLARAAAMALCYRTAHKSGVFGEAHIRDIHRHMALLLGRDDAMVQLAQVEQVVERANLYANKALVLLVNRCAARGQKVILLTDMYLGAKEVGQLIDAVCGTCLPVTALRSSADLRHSKRSGTAFAAAAEALDVALGDIFHIGDNHDVDVAAAQTAGCHALHFPILRAERVRRSIDLACVTKELQQRGIRTNGWAKA